MNSSTSKGNNSPSAVTGNKLPDPSDYHLWWMLVKLVIKLQPILETAAGKRCKGLQNMNFCSKTCIHLAPHRLTHTSTPRGWQRPRRWHLCSAPWAMALVEHPAWELGAAYVILSLSIYAAILQGEGVTSCGVPQMLYIVTCSVGTTFTQGNLPRVTFHTVEGSFWGKNFFLSLNNN